MSVSVAVCFVFELTSRDIKGDTSEDTSCPENRENVQIFPFVALCGGSINTDVTAVVFLCQILAP